MNAAERQVALEHVIGVVNAYGYHSSTACPPFTRAMCNHYSTLLDLEVEGWKWPSEGPRISSKEHLIEKLRGLREYVRSQSWDFDYTGPEFDFLMSRNAPLPHIREGILEKFEDCGSCGEAVDIINTAIEGLKHGA